MATLKDLFTRRSSNSKSLFDYMSYKYEDIHSTWIIHQGNLQYLYNTTFLGDSIFKTCCVVLTRIPFDNMKDMIGLYLYNDDKKLLHFFSVDKKTKINDRCNRVIKPDPKCFLFELNFFDKDKPEIFGAKNDTERQIWIKKLQNAFQKSEIEEKKSDFSYLSPTSTRESVEVLSLDPGRFYPSFEPNDFQSINVENNFNNNNQINNNFSKIESDSNLSPYSIVEPTDCFQFSANNNNENISPNIQKESNNDLYLLEEKTFLWEDMFYSNEKDDYKIVLAKTDEYGAFLIRPQSKITSSSDHDYTLCMYFELNNIRCFGIHQLPIRGNEYSLSKKGLKSFVDITELCQYYTTNPLPMLTKNIYLKKPYKLYYKK